MENLIEHDLVDSEVDLKAFNANLSKAILEVKTIINFDTDDRGEPQNPSYTNWQNSTQSRVALYGKQDTSSFVKEDIKIGTELLGSLLLTTTSSKLKREFERICQNGKVTVIDIRTDDPDITNFPWELCVKADWQTLEVSTPNCNLVVVRIPKPTRVVKWNLTDNLERARILVVGLVDDGTRGTPPPSFDAEFTAIKNGLSVLPMSRYKLTPIAKGLTISDLSEIVRTEQPHVIHLIAHGAAGRVEMRNVTGGAINISGALLSSALQQAKDSLVMFVSTACLIMKDAPQNKILGIGNALTTFIPFVVGMQLEISDAMARCYSAEFYRSLANSKNILEAHIIAREAVWDARKDSPEWIAPVIYQCLNEDNYIFPKFDIRAFVSKKLTEVDDLIVMLREARRDNALRLPLADTITIMCNSIEEKITEPFSERKLDARVMQNSNLFLIKLDDANRSLLRMIIDFGNVVRTDLSIQTNKELGQLGQRFDDLLKQLREFRSILAKLEDSL